MAVKFPAPSETDEASRSKSSVISSFADLPYCPPPAPLPLSVNTIESLLSCEFFFVVILINLICHVLLRHSVLLSFRRVPVQRLWFPCSPRHQQRQVEFLDFIRCGRCERLVRDNGCRVHLLYRTNSSCDVNPRCGCFPER